MQKYNRDTKLAPRCNFPDKQGLKKIHLGASVSRVEHVYLQRDITFFSVVFWTLKRCVGNFESKLYRYIDLCIQVSRIFI